MQLLSRCRSQGLVLEASEVAQQTLAAELHLLEASPGSAITEHSAAFEEQSAQAESARKLDELRRERG